MALILPSRRQFFCDIHMGAFARWKHHLFGKAEIEETAVVGEELNAFAAEDLF